MMMMKKTVTAVLLLAMLAATGCASSDITVGTGSWDGKEGTTAEKSEAASELTDVTTKVFTNSIGTTWVVGIATVKNTGNCDLYISNAGMDIETADGKLVDTMTLASATPTVISPGETTIIYGEQTVSAEGDYKVVPTYKAVEAKIPNTRYEVSDVSLSEDDLMGTLEVVGRVENSGDEDRRPQFQRLRRDAGKKIFDTIIAYKSSRIARNMLNALNFEVEMTKCGVNVLYAKEEFGNTAAGRFALRTMMSVNQFYSENLGEDIKRTQADNAQNCRANGPAPYGYKSGADGRFEIDEPAAAIVREIYARVAACETIASIAMDLNARGVKTSRGREWGRNSFHRIIGNERYLGIYIFDKTRVVGGMPRIIDDSLYREPMTGMCGAGKSGAVYYYYSCVGRRTGSGCKKDNVGRDRIEDAVARALVERIMNDEIIDQIADEVMEYQRRHKDQPEIKMLEEQKAENAKAIKNILAAIEAGIFTESTKARLMELEAASTKISEQLALLTADQINVTRDQVVGYLKSFRGGDVSDRQYRMQLFQTFLVKVFVFNNRLKIVFDPLGSGKNEVDVTLDDVAGSGDGVRLSSPVGHHIGLRRTPYIIFMVSLAAK